MSELALPVRSSSNTLTIVSFVCLALQPLWIAACYLLAASPGPDQPTADDVVKGEIAVFAAAGAAFVGICLLSVIGVAFGIAARRSGWGLLALVLNAVVFLGTTVPLLLLILKLHG
jgi:hypothetical protein